MLSPDLVQQLALGYYLPSVMHERGQEFVFNGGEVDRLFGNLHLPSCQVDMELARLYRPDASELLRSVRNMAQRHTYARQQLAHPKGLGHVVVGSSVKGRNLVGFSTTRRKDDDRHGRPLAQPACHLQTVEVGESEVEKNERRLTHRGLAESFLRRGGGDHLVAIGLQRGAEDAANRRFIFDDQDSGTEVCHTIPKHIIPAPDLVRFQRREHLCQNHLSVRWT